MSDVVVNSGSQKFWVEDPMVLVKNICNIFPTEGMDDVEKLNSLTRLALIISGALFYLKYDQWMIFLVGSLVVILWMWYSKHGNNKHDDTKRENFTIVPTYPGTDMHQTTVAPLYAEEWQIQPPAYDLYENSPPGNITFEEPIHPQQYPYGQYLTKTNLLPSDEFATHQLNGGTREARNYANTAFLNHSLAHRENMTRIYKKSLERRFRSNSNDTFSPFSSY